MIPCINNTVMPHYIKMVYYGRCAKYVLGSICFPWIDSFRFEHNKIIKPMAEKRDECEKGTTER